MPDIEPIYNEQFPDPAQEANPYAGPAIYEQGQRVQRAPLPESAFRPFQEGGDAGTLDPRFSGMDVPDEQMIRHTEKQLGAMSLSQPERLRLQRLQNAASRVQEDALSGNLAPFEAQRAMGMLQQQMQPLMVRRSEVPTLMRVLQFQQMRQQMARQTALMQENARFRALSAEERTHTYTDENGRPTRFIEQPNGTLVRVREDTTESQQANQEQRRHDTVTRQAEQQANHEITQAAQQSRQRDAEGNTTHVDPAFIQRINRDPQFAAALRRYGPLDTTNVPAMRELYVRYLADQRMGQQGGAQRGQSAQPQQPQQPMEPQQERTAALTGLNSLRNLVATHPNREFRNNPNTLADINDIQRLIEEHGPVSRMLPEIRREYDRLAFMVQRALTNFSLEGRTRTQPASQSSGPGFGDIPWGQYGVP